MPVRPAVHLQISLHATNDETRRRLVPYAPDSIAHLLAAGLRFHEKTKDQVCLNYVLLKGVNDSEEDARWLGRLSHTAFYIKIAMLNSVVGMPTDFIGSSPTDLVAFAHRLQKYQMPHKIFIGDGFDIHASCGQLAAVPREIDAFGCSS